MLQTIPGYCHLKLLVPTTTTAQSPQVTLPNNGPIRACIQVVLDAACGMRTTASLPRAWVSPRVRSHITAFQKAHAIRGPVAVRHIDVRPAPIPKNADPLAIHIEECVDTVGSYQVGKRVLAFAARLERPDGKRQWIIRSLRLF